MPRPHDVGVGVAVALVRPDGRVLLGLRKGAHGAGLWSLPGGWIDRADASIDAAAVREVEEETGIRIPGTRRLLETSVDFLDFRGITLFRWAEVEERVEPVVREPDKCAQWRWTSLDAVPDALFPGVNEALFALSCVMEKRCSHGRLYLCVDCVYDFIGPRRRG